jgi:hypothetical protein
MRDLLLSELQDGHTAVRVLMLVAGLWAMAWLAFQPERKQAA